MMSEVIKELVKGYLNNLELSDLEMGLVVSINPIKIKIPNLIEPIGSSFLIIPIRLNGSFKVNDKVAMLKSIGGQKYYIMDKVV